MKQKLLLLILFIATATSYAQIPTNYVAKYNFSNSSLTNLANPGIGDILPTSPNTAVFATDRGASTNNALDCNNVKHTGFNMVSGGPSVTEIALSFWVNMENEPSTATQEERVIDYVNANGNGISFGIDATGFFYVSTRLNNTSRRRVFSDSNLANANWNHIFLQFRKVGNSYFADAFINGVRNDILSNDTSMPGVGTAPLFTGNNNEYAQLIINESRNFSGNIDDIRLYHSALGTADVQNLFNEGAAQIQCSTIVNIPDSVFKTALLAHGISKTGPGISLIDTNRDGEICTTEAQAYSGTIDVANKNISDITGVEAFTNINVLYVNSNQLTSLDVSNNTNLSTLYFNDNVLTDVDVSANTALTVLYAFNNQLTSLNVTNGNNSAITIMRAEGNPNLTCIQHDTGFTPHSGWQKDASASWSTNCSGSTCTSIVSIPNANFKAALLDHGVGITGTGISVIDTDGDGEICTTEAQAYTGSISVVSKNISNMSGIESFTNLTSLDCGFNQLTSIDVSSNTALTTLEITQNQITSIDVSSNTALVTFLSDDNQLTTLDVSANTSLQYLNCQSNTPLSTLNVANGNNANMTVSATNNANLTCIQHDSNFDPTTNNNWTKDAAASWSTNCSGSTCTSTVSIPNANFKAALLDHGVGITGTGISVIDTDGDGEICTTEALAYTGKIKVDSKNISNLSGIESFTNITELDCGFNQITTINVSSNTQLTSLNCENNQLSVIDISSNTGLTFLNLANNMLSNINLTSNIALVDLTIRYNSLSELNIGSNIALNVLICNDNQITGLNLSQNVNLTSIFVYNNQLTELDVANGNNVNVQSMDATNNSNLSCIQHDNNFDPTTSNNWTKDAAANWSTNCSLSVNDEVFNSKVKIYPNPATTVLNISSEITSIKSVEIYNILGSKVMDTNTQNIDISGLTSGMYVVKIKSNDNRFAIKKFVKQ